MRRVRLHRKEYGPGQRLSHQEEILDNKPIVPNPVEYEDIDNAFFEFFKNTLGIVDDNGEKVPIFTLYSNQRFSEYSQTWQHSDKDGNLLMNFLTVNRENNPNFGSIHGGNYNIPDRWFTIRIREIKDENGIECYEVTSMRQPVQVDMIYRLGFITSKYERLNKFNTDINELFASRQCYLCVNGHYMPMVVDSVSDETSYSVDERKFFTQTVIMKLIGYVIPEGSIKVELKPKRERLTVPLDRPKKANVSLGYVTDENVIFELNFDEETDKVEFTSEDNMMLELGVVENARRIRVTVNDDEVDISGKFRILEGDEVSVSFLQPKRYRKSKIVFNGVLV